ncbi:MAG: cupin domain-containing protein [Rivularia sp. (in: Bacteria)]|nr:cupin domain-containing protein [Rivularia sp. MS3]
MNTNKKPQSLIKAEAIKQLPQQTFSHPLNPNSEISGASLSELVGLQRIGFHLAKIAPGKESFIYHSHEFEEEFIYILSGKGIAEIDNQEFEVGEGDFMGFPTPSVAHHLRNPFEQELIYIMGGERREYEVADFPRLQKRMFRNRQQNQIAEYDNLKSFM